MTDAKDERAFGRLLHEQLLRAEPDAASAIYIAYRDRVAAHLRFKARGYGERTPDEEMINDAVTEAFAKYFERPATFDPEQKSLFGYLKMSALGDYKNLIEKRKRRPVLSVGIEDKVWNKLADDDSSSVEDDVTNDDGSEFVVKLRSQCVKSNEDRVIYELLLDRIRDTNSCLEALGWPQGAESTERLRNAKERIIKCLRRAHSRFVQENR
jgi:DNA-directed RNA polymerase specialized sigma24 family protein